MPWTPRALRCQERCQFRPLSCKHFDSETLFIFSVPLARRCLRINFFIAVCKNSPVYPSTDLSPTLRSWRQRLINYFTSKDSSPDSMNYDALRAATECKWTEVRQQLSSMQATRHCLIKTDLESQPDPFKTKPSPKRRAVDNSCQSKLSAIFISSFQSKNLPIVGTK